MKIKVNQKYFCEHYCVYNNIKKCGKNFCGLPRCRYNFVQSSLKSHKKGQLNADEMDINKNDN